MPAYHDVGEFATALRAVGEPMRGKPVGELSVGQMLDGLFAITRDFDMQTQPHLLLLQKTMVMVEGVATMLDPEINMWDVSGPYVKRMAARRAGAGSQTRRPDLRRGPGRSAPCPASSSGRGRLPARQAAPSAPPLQDIQLIDVRTGGGLLRHALSRSSRPRSARRRCSASRTGSVASGRMSA